MFGLVLPWWVPLVAWAPVALGVLVVTIASSGWWRWSYAQRHFWFQRKRRDALVGNRCYEGLPGSNKTVAAVRDGIRFLRSGVIVASNITVRDPKTGRRALPCGDWLAMMDLSVQALERGVPIVFLIDEAGCWADARDWKDVPSWFDDFMRQRRHYGVGMIVTVQNLFQLDKRFRGLIDEFIRIEPMLTFWPHLGAVFTTPCRVSGSDANEVVEYGEKKGLGWLAGWAYHGYDTREMVPGRRWEKDAERDAFALELYHRAEAVTAVDEIPAYVDRDGVIEAQAGA